MTAPLALTMPPSNIPQVRHDLRKDRRSPPRLPPKNRPVRTKRWQGAYINIHRWSDTRLKHEDIFDRRAPVCVPARLQKGFSGPLCANPRGVGRPAIIELDLPAAVRYNPAINPMKARLLLASVAALNLATLALAAPAVQPPGNVTADQAPAGQRLAMAKAGDPLAQALLARAYLYGTDGKVPNQKTGAAWAERSAGSIIRWVCSCRELVVTMTSHGPWRSAMKRRSPSLHRPLPRALKNRRSRAAGIGRTRGRAPAATRETREHATEIKVPPI